MIQKRLLLAALLSTALGAHPAAAEGKYDFICQELSDTFGVIANVTFGTSGTFQKDVWKKYSCMTTPTCQALSNKYAIVAGKGFGFAPADTRPYWSQKGCNTQPEASQIGRLCQQMSDQFGVVANVTFGSADTEAQNSWKALGCNTKPTPQEKPGIYKMYAMYTAQSIESGIPLGRDVYVRYMVTPDQAGSMRLVESGTGQVLASRTVKDCFNTLEFNQHVNTDGCALTMRKIGKFQVEMTDAKGKRLAETEWFESRRPVVGDFSFQLSCYNVTRSGNSLKARCKKPERGTGGAQLSLEKEIKDISKCMEISNQDGVLTCETEYNGVRMP